MLSGLWKRDIGRGAASLAAGLSGACTPMVLGMVHTEGLNIIPVPTTRTILGSSQPPPGHRNPSHWPRHTQQLPLPSPDPRKGWKTFPALSCRVPPAWNMAARHRSWPGRAPLSFSYNTFHWSLTPPRNVKHLHCYQRMLLEIPAKLIGDFQKYS